MFRISVKWKKVNWKLLDLKVRRSTRFNRVCPGEVGFRWTLIQEGEITETYFVFTCHWGLHGFTLCVHTPHTCTQHTLTVQTHAHSCMGPVQGGRSPPSLTGRVLSLTGRAKPWGRDLLSPGCPPSSDLCPYVGWMSPQSLSLPTSPLCEPGEPFLLWICPFHQELPFHWHKK